MHFRCTARFSGVTLAEYEKLYWNETFNVAMCKDLGLQRTPVANEDKDGTVRRVVKVAPEREIPAPVQKVLGGARIEYTEHAEYVWGSGAGTWKTVSSLLTDKVKSSGTFRFVEVPGGVERTVEGDIDVKIFGLGGLVEKFIVADVEKSYDKAAEFTRKWLNKG